MLSDYPLTGLAGSEPGYLVTPRLLNKQTTKRGLITFHGHGGGALHGLISGTLFGSHTPAIVNTGIAVIGSDNGGVTNWGLAGCMTSADALWTYLTTILGCQTKVGVAGYSMGGLGALNWIKRNPTKVGRAWLWEPVTDLDWAHSTGGYTPAYGGSVAGNSGWTTEIEAACAGGVYSASAGYRVRDEYSTWNGICPIEIVHASDDSVVPPAQSTAFVAGVADAQVTLRSPVPIGNHTGVFAQVPTAESAAFWGQPW